jgi:hydroxymethylbilane synthase
MLPAPGQGALGVQCRAGDDATQELLWPLDDAPTRAAVTAERAFLGGLGGGCAIPVAAHAVCGATGSVCLTGLVVAPDGRREVRLAAEDHDPRTLGLALANTALARGALELLA